MRFYEFEQGEILIDQQSIKQIPKKNSNLILDLCFKMHLFSTEQLHRI